MSKIIRVDIHDGLLLPSGYLAQAEYTCILYLRVPDEWLSGDLLLEPQQEAILENMYGKSWRQGNEDDSRYAVLEMSTTLLTPEQEAERIWLQHPPGARQYRYWYYHVTSDGRLQGSDQEYFNL